MKLAGIPSGKARFMARITVRDHNAGERLIRDMVRDRTVSWRVRSTMTSRALISHRHLGVIPIGRLPTDHSVAANTVKRCGNVHRNLSGRRRAVMTASAVSSAGEERVIRASAQPSSGGLMAALTVTGDSGVNSGAWFACESIDTC
ncbi:MAG: hypothetical protein RLY95_625 [Pseudomonadota bacterium]